MPGRYRVPAMPPKKRGEWPPTWLELAHREALDHAMLMAEVGDRWCVYCGEEADHADHLVPLPVSGPELRRFVPTLPACASCNGTLADFHSPIVAARSAHIAMHLHRRYRIRKSDDIDRCMVSPPARRLACAVDRAATAVSPGVGRHAAGGPGSRHAHPEP